AEIEGLGMAGDLIGQLQYLDLVQNRRFRMSLLCHEGLKPDRAPSADRLRGFYWTTGLRPQTPIETLEAAGQPLALAGPLGDVRLTTTDRLSGAVFDTLCRQRQAVTPGEVVKETMRRFALDDEAGLSAALAAPALDLVMSNAIQLHSAPESWVADISERP